MPSYVCNNFGSCPAAGNVIELPIGAEPVCPDDGYVLEEVKPKSTGKKTWVVSGLGALVIVIGVGGFFWKIETKPMTVEQAKNAPASSGVLPDIANQTKAKLDVDRTILNRNGIGAPTEQKAVIAREYVKAAVAFLRLHKWQEASEELIKAKKEYPDEPLIYVNQAIVHLKLGREKDAVAELETAFRKGFKDFRTIEADTDLKPLTTKPEYGAMVVPFKTK